MAKTSGNTVRAGRAFVELFADDSKLVRGLRAAQRRLKAFGTAVAKMGANLIRLGGALMAPMLAAVRQFSRVGSTLSDISARTGASVESLSELGFAAEQSGSSLEALGNAMFRARRRIANAATGSGPAVRALRELGLNAKELSQVAPEHQLEILADALRGLEDPALAAQLGFEILGDQFKALAPLLAGGSKGIRELRQQARDLGLTVSKEDADAASDFANRWAILGRVVKMGFFRIGAALGPMLADLMTRITGVTQRISEWISQNRALIVGVFRMAALIAAVGVAFVAVGTSIIFLGSLIGSLAVAVAKIGLVLGVAAKALMFLLSPIGLVTAAVAGLAIWLIRASGAGGAALAWLGDRFGDLLGKVTAVMGGIRDALMSGDIALAGEVMWRALQVVWQEGISRLRIAFITFRSWLTEQAVNAWAGLQASWELITHNMARAWTWLTSALRRLWVNFTSWHTRITESLGNSLLKFWTRIRAKIDPSIDVEFQLQQIDQIQGASRQANERERQADLAAIDKSYEADRKKREQQHQDRMTEISKENQALLAAIDKIADEQIGEAADALKAARAALVESIKQAAQQRQEQDRQTEGRLSGLDEIWRKWQEAAEGMEAAAAQIEARGTFSAAAIQSLQVSSVDRRIADASEETARNTRRLVMQHQTGPVFG